MKDARSEAIKKISRKESGESESYENNLEKSERYMDGKNRFKSRYKEFYDDVKLSSKEDW
ncbi:MAG TPA: hypothetical protein IAC70_03555 [Candidatus Faecicola pullistercoris]|nr:hypothetical protein [Candidatus Faecicola pullistercoris]